VKQKNFKFNRCACI